jgi:hypothetical protein
MIFVIKFSMTHNCCVFCFKITLICCAVYWLWDKNWMSSLFLVFDIQTQFLLICLWSVKFWIVYTVSLICCFWVVWLMMVHALLFFFSSLQILFICRWKWLQHTLLFCVMIMTSNNFYAFFVCCSFVAFVCCLFFFQHYKSCLLFCWKMLQHASQFCVMIITSNNFYAFFGVNRSFVAFQCCVWWWSMHLFI